MKWCPGAESNDRHKDFQSFALPTELPGFQKIYIKFLLSCHTPVTTEAKMATIRRRNKKYQVQVRKNTHKSISKKFNDLKAAKKWANHEEYLQVF